MINNYELMNNSLVLWLRRNHDALRVNLSLICTHGGTLSKYIESLSGFFGHYVSIQVVKVWGSVYIFAYQGAVMSKPCPLMISFCAVSAVGSP